MTRRVRIEDGKSEGVSPKVSWPVVVLLIGALLCFLAGLDVEARTLLAAALAGGGAGVLAGPGAVASK